MTRKSQIPSDSGAGGPRAAEPVVGLRNLSGIPVLEVLGELNQTAVAAVYQLALELVAAGHYHLVLNIEKAIAGNGSVVGLLGRVAAEARRHYGQLTLVTGPGGADLRLPKELERAVRTCRSETAALAPLKGVCNIPDAAHCGTPARLV